MIGPTRDEYYARLIAEIECYLEAVELFRALGCEPDWCTETRAAVSADEAARNRSPAVV